MPIDNIHHVNNYNTTLTSAISSSDGTIAVVDALSPVPGMFLTISDGTNLEIVKVGSVSNGTSIGVTRAQQGTPAGTFASGVAVFNAITADELNQTNDLLRSVDTRVTAVEAGGGAGAGGGGGGDLFETPVTIAPVGDTFPVPITTKSVHIQTTATANNVNFETVGIASNPIFTIYNITVLFEFNYQYSLPVMKVNGVIVDASTITLNGSTFTPYNADELMLADIRITKWSSNFYFSAVYRKVQTT